MSQQRKSSERCYDVDFCGHLLFFHHVEELLGQFDPCVKRNIFSSFSLRCQNLETLKIVFCMRERSFPSFQTFKIELNQKERCFINL